jgi:hypothetical protein
VIVADFRTRVIYPNNTKDDLTYYKPRPKEKLLPSIGNFQKQWINACKTDLRTACDFEYSGNYIETMLLGMVAYKAGKKINYDPRIGLIPDDPNLNSLLTRKYREGWNLNG